MDHHYVGEWPWVVCVCVVVGWGGWVGVVVGGGGCGGGGGGAGDTRTRPRGVQVMWRVVGGGGGLVRGGACLLRCASGSSTHGCRPCSRQAERGPPTPTHTHTPYTPPTPTHKPPSLPQTRPSATASPPPCTITCLAASRRTWPRSCAELFGTWRSSDGPLHDAGCHRQAQAAGTRRSWPAPHLRPTCTLHSFMTTRSLPSPLTCRFALPSPPF